METKDIIDSLKYIIDDLSDDTRDVFAGEIKFDKDTLYYNIDPELNIIDIEIINK